METDDFEDDEPDEYEKAISNCCGFFEGGYFMCGAVGSEDCDECPFYGDLGLTAEQIQDRLTEELTAILTADQRAAGNAEYDSWLSPPSTENPPRSYK